MHINTAPEKKTEDNYPKVLLMLKTMLVNIGPQNYWIPGIWDYYSMTQSFYRMLSFTAILYILSNWQ